MVVEPPNYMRHIAANLAQLIRIHTATLLANASVTNTRECTEQIHALFVGIQIAREHLREDS